MLDYYRGGGRPKKSKMILAHFNPRELNDLDYFQGKKETDPRTGLRSYGHLEELLKNPHLFRTFIREAQKAPPPSSHAKGGHLHNYHNARLNHLANEGVNGDTEVALIGPHTKNALDSILKMHGMQVTENPLSHHPHYADLAPFMNGLSNTLNPPQNNMGGMAQMAPPQPSSMSTMGAPPQPSYLSSMRPQTPGLGQPSQSTMGQASPGQSLAGQPQTTNQSYMPSAWANQ